MQFNQILVKHHAHIIKISFNVGNEYFANSGVMITEARSTLIKATVLTQELVSEVRGSFCLKFEQAAGMVAIIRATN